MLLGASGTATAGMVASQGDGSASQLLLGGAAMVFSGFLSSKLGTAFDEHQKKARDYRDIFLNHDLHKLAGEASTCCVRPARNITSPGAC